jgi:hypothetical protein
MADAPKWRAALWTDIRVGTRVVFLWEYQADDGPVKKGAVGYIHSKGATDCIVSLGKEGKRRVLIRNVQARVASRLLGVAVAHKLYSDYPNVHWLLAGDATANSVPFNAHGYLANLEVSPEYERVFAEAEAWLATQGLGEQKLFEAGYETSGYMSLDNPDECIGDIEDPAEQEAARAALYTKWGIEHPSIVALFAAIY